RIFHPEGRGLRRVILATNVAETSLTVPGIRYVIDAGFARISRYSARSRLQRLPIEPISQASANQRAGRCGRVEPGICLRLYAESDFQPIQKSSAPSSHLSFCNVWIFASVTP
ncbi:MAG: helicase-related protein, partial [Litorivicinaceae bacterium]